MRLEGLVTCLALGEWDEANEAYPLPALLGVFQRLRFVPDGFFVYFDLRTLGVTAGLIQVRLRRRGRAAHMLYESVPEAVAFDGPMYPMAHEIVDLTLPPGAVVVEVIVNDSILGSRVVEFA